MEKLLNYSDEELLLDMLEYYSEDKNRRCINGTTCVYSPETAGLEGVSEGCAVGRLLPPEVSKYIDDEYGEIGICELVDEPFSTDEIAKAIEKKSNILYKMQLLHDDNNNWSDQGLTMKGKSKVEFIIADFNMDRNKFLKFLN